MRFVFNPFIRESLVKKILIMAVSIFCLVVFEHVSLAWEARYNSNTGDTSLDTALGSMNMDARGNISAFVNEMSVAYGTPKSQIEAMVGKRRMDPADAYMALEVGKRTGRSLDDVLESYEKNKGKGWGAIAQEMGIKPGSKEFHALKENAHEHAAKGKKKDKKKDKDDSNDQEEYKDKGKGKGKSDKSRGKGKK